MSVNPTRPPPKVGGSLPGLEWWPYEESCGFQESRFLKLFRGEEGIKGRGARRGDGGGCGAGWCEKTGGGVPLTLGGGDLS